MKWMGSFGWLRFLCTKEKDVLVESRIEVIAVDGCAVPHGSKLQILVKTEVADPDYVVFQIGGKKYTVAGNDMIKAVKNVLRK